MGLNLLTGFVFLVFVGRLGFNLARCLVFGEVKFFLNFRLTL